MRHFLLVPALRVGCSSRDGGTPSGTPDTGSGTDAIAGDTAVDTTATDTTSTDTSTDDTAKSDTSTTDTAVTDSGSGDTGTTVDTGADTKEITCGGSTTCHAYWCGCGKCDPATITCINFVKGCALGCVSSCPELTATTCTCVGGACTKS
jgi:hypothetical protein